MSRRTIIVISALALTFSCAESSSPKDKKSPPKAEEVIPKLKDKPTLGYVFSLLMDGFYKVTNDKGHPVYHFKLSDQSRVLVGISTGTSNLVFIDHISPDGKTTDRIYPAN
jgi:hypothetical protein